MRNSKFQLSQLITFHVDMQTRIVLQIHVLHLNDVQNYVIIRFIFMNIYHDAKQCMSIITSIP